MQDKVCKKSGDVYYIMNRQERLGFFLQKRRNYTILCGRCQKDDCYNCNRFNYIREQLEKMLFSKDSMDQRVSPDRANRFYGRFLTIF